MGLKLVPQTGPQATDEPSRLTQFILRTWLYGYLKAGSHSSLSVLFSYALGWGGNLM